MSVFCVVIMLILLRFGPRMDGEEDEEGSSSDGGFGGKEGRSPSFTGSDVADLRSFDEGDHLPLRGFDGKQYLSTDSPGGADGSVRREKKLSGSVSTSYSAAAR